MPKKLRENFSKRSLSTNAIINAPLATLPDLNAMKDEIAILYDKSMPAAPKPIHQGEQ